MLGQFKGHFWIFQSILQKYKLLNCQIWTKNSENIKFKKVPQKSFMRAPWFPALSGGTLARLFWVTREKKMINWKIVKKQKLLKLLN